MAHQAGAYPGFCSMKRLRVFLLPPGWDASPSQGYPQHEIRRYPFIHLGGEKHCEKKLSCPRTQHNVPGQDSNPDRSVWRRTYFSNFSTNHEATHLPRYNSYCMVKLSTMKRGNSVWFSVRPEFCKMDCSEIISLIFFQEGTVRNPAI